MLIVIISFFYFIQLIYYTILTNLAIKVLMIILGLRRAIFRPFNDKVFYLSRLKDPRAFDCITLDDTMGNYQACVINSSKRGKQRKKRTLLWDEKKKKNGKCFSLMHAKRMM